MTTGPQGAGPATYELLVRGELSDDFIMDLGARRFDPSRGKTTLLVDVIDQSHLHGVWAGSRITTSMSRGSIRL